jgi:hypothetical protein
MLPGNKTWISGISGMCFREGTKIVKAIFGVGVVILLHGE